MISRNSEGGFLAAHWDWLIAGAGILALVVGAVVFLLADGGDPEANAAASVSRLMSKKKSETGVKPVDMAAYERALQLATKPPVIAEVTDEEGNFLVSARRIFCAHCAKPIPGDSKKCPLCGGDQPERAPILLVMMTTVFEKSTVRPWPSVRRPSSRICSRMLKTSGWAFSISSKRTTE